MAITNRDRIQRCLDELHDGLAPFIEQNLKTGWGANWVQRLDQSGQYPVRKNNDGTVHWDSQLLLKTMFNNWNEVFRDILGHAERSYVSELREVRNNFAHEKPFSSDDTLRALDTAQRLLSAVSAQDQAKNLESMRAELMRTVFQEQARQQTRKKTLTLKTESDSRLKPWRDVVTPHKDVASGRYQQAEFAADLAQVYRGEGEAEYRDPEEFFRRTYLTQGLTHLLTGALQRLSGEAVIPWWSCRPTSSAARSTPCWRCFTCSVTCLPLSLPASMPCLGNPVSPRSRRPTGQCW
ncbi:MAG: Swt1 family HEPN domain-containing protein [Sedimenticola sp.]